MIQPELLKNSSAPKIVVGTWAMSRGEPHLFYWRDHNSYDDDPYMFASASPREQSPDEVARAAVINSLVFEGIDEERAKKAIRGSARCGTLVCHFLEEGAEGVEQRRRRAALIFVEVMPSALTELTRRDHHLLLPARVIHPHSRWNSSLERRVALAFKRFVSTKVV